MLPQGPIRAIVSRLVSLTLVLTTMVMVSCQGDSEKSESKGTQSGRDVKKTSKLFDPVIRPMRAEDKSKKPVYILYSVDDAEPIFQASLVYRIQALRLMCKSGDADINWVVILNGHFVHKVEDKRSMLVCKDGVESLVSLKKDYDDLIEKLATKKGNQDEALILRVPFIGNPEEYKKYPLSHPQMAEELINGEIFGKNGVFDPKAYSGILNLFSHGNKSYVMTVLDEKERVKRIEEQNKEIADAGLNPKDFVFESSELGLLPFTLDEHIELAKKLAVLGDASFVKIENFKEVVGYAVVSSTERLGTPERDRVGGDRVGGDRVGGDRVGGDRVGGDRIGGDRIGGDRVGGDRVGGDRVGGDRVGGDRVGDHARLGGDRIGGDRIGYDNHFGFPKPLAPILLMRLGSNISYVVFESCENEVSIKTPKEFMTLPEKMTSVSYFKYFQGFLDRTYSFSKWLIPAAFSFEHTSYYAPRGGLNFQNVDWDFVFLRSLNASASEKLVKFHNELSAQLKLAPNYFPVE